VAGARELSSVWLTVTVTVLSHSDGCVGDGHAEVYVPALLKAAIGVPGRIGAVDAEGWIERARRLRDHGPGIAEVCRSAIVRTEDADGSSSCRSPPLAKPGRRRHGRRNWFAGAVTVTLTLLVTLNPAASVMVTTKV